MTPETFPIFGSEKDNDAAINQYGVIVGDPRGSRKVIGLTYHKATETTTVNSFRTLNFPYLSTMYATLLAIVCQVERPPTR
jgi:hypothetical protein